MNNQFTNVKFENFNIYPEIIKALKAKGIEYCTSVQSKSLQPMLEGRDIIAEAPTGTGKTFAYGIPLIMNADRGEKDIQSLILAPTRELVQQIEAELAALCSEIEGLSLASIFGGESLRKQIAELKHDPAILIATPGRLIDHMKRGHIQLDKIRSLVLDEADRMLDMGFIDDVRYILNRSNKNKQLALFTATLSREVLDISWVFQKDPIEVRVEAMYKDKPSIKEYYLIANGSERIEAIHDLLMETKAEKALVFVNMKQSADITARKLRDKGYRAEALQGDMRQKQRNKVMENFRFGSLQILVGTDVAARGLDIEEVDLVFNYDLPQDLENYIHRIGRTGRAGRDGLAVSFVAPGEEENFALFCRKLRISPERYAWKRPLQEEQFISKEKEEEVARRIRAKYLKQKLDASPSARPDKTASSRKRKRKSKGNKPFPADNKKPRTKRPAEQNKSTKTSGHAKINRKKAGKAKYRDF